MKRFASLDVIKTWSMFLVVMIHIIVGLEFFPATWWSTLFTLFTVTSVPLFLMVNGALLLNKPFIFEKWLRRLCALMVLTFLWKIALVLICRYFWNVGGTAVTVRTVLQYAFGGPSPYGQLGYTWFLEMYIGLQILFPLIKLIYDHKDRRYITIVTLSLLVLVLGGYTLSMVLQPLDTFLGTEGLTQLFSDLFVYTPFSESAIYFVYFVFGGILFKQIILEPSENNEVHIKLGKRSLCLSSKHFVIMGIVCYVILYALARYQATYLGQKFDVIQRYTNVFSVGLSCSCFVFLITRHYGKLATKFCNFIGKRTFGIYVLQIIPISVADATIGRNAPAVPLFPDGAGMPPVFAMLYLLAVIALMMILLAMIIALLERIPNCRKLFFS